MRSDRTYLVTGGRGGLGPIVAARLAALGARHLALLGRRPATLADATRMAGVEALGARVHHVVADITSREGVVAALADLAEVAPPIAGVVHAATVLHDATIANQSGDTFREVIDPKVRGVLFLRELIPGLELEIYFASLAGVVGSGGQSNYASANAFLDALARASVQAGRRVTSLDWGPWAEVGIAAKTGGNSLGLADGFALSPAEGAALFEVALAEKGAQLVLGRVNLHDPRLASQPLLRDLVPRPASSASIVQTLGRLPPVERATAAFAHLRSTVAAISGTTPDQIEARHSLKELGFDSLGMVSLRNRILMDFGISVTVAQLYAHPHLGAVAGLVASAVATPVATPTPYRTASNEQAQPADSDLASELDLELDQILGGV